MSRIVVKSERVVNARPEDVYTVLTDYKEKRPRILTPNFLDYQVEKGGHGEGTVISYRLQAARRERPYRIQVNETVKGQVLTERDTISSLVTTWTLSPLNGGQQTRVSVVTEWEGGRGIGGFFERTFAPLGLRRIYANMLSSLEAQVSPGGTTTAQDGKGIARNVGPFLLLFGIVIAMFLGIGYIRKLRQ